MTDLRTLLGDKEFMKHITEMENAEDVQKAFKEKGVDLTLGQIEEIGSIINATVEKGSALSEDELEDISGGGLIGDAWDKTTSFFSSFTNNRESTAPNIEVKSSNVGGLSKYLDSPVETAGIITVSAAIGAGILYGTQKAVKWYKKRKKN